MEVRRGRDGRKEGRRGAGAGVKEREVKAGNGGPSGGGVVGGGVECFTRSAPHPVTSG